MFPIPKGALVVSCQAREDNPLHGPRFMAAMALAAAQGGALGLRANGAADIAAIRAVTDLPVIGIAKDFDPAWPVYITPNFESARPLAAAGAALIALDATARPRNGDPLDVLIPRIKRELGVAVFADCDTLETGLAAAKAGADCLGTTLSGYTEATGHLKAKGPDLDLISALVAASPLPVIAEGRLDTPELVAEAFRRGAHAVVVGTAITNPREITRRFAAVTPAGAA